jgi:hypothetical protein
MLGTLQGDCNGGQLRREKKGSEHAGIYHPVVAELERVTPMKAANAILLTMVLLGSIALSQTSPTEKAAASGTCSPAPVADNNAYNLNCNGIGVD